MPSTFSAISETCRTTRAETVAAQHPADRRATELPRPAADLHATYLAVLS